ncbi:MAG TPA: hypothetical protein VGO68_05825 [Pyrinomonadaceae bacterium]|jgi:hypothetical protein|nr:hypothetical protein [Pyrinomonadaceae bacterium]
MPQRIGRALAYALLIWITGFVWGMVVFMTPAMKEVPAIPYVSRYPLISFPLLILWLLIAYVLARKHLNTTSAAPGEGLRLGVLFVLVNFVLDLLVLVILFKNGPAYFASLTVWLAYLILLTVPWFTGRSLATANGV